MNGVDFPIPVVQRELVPEGTHLAICVQLIDIGTQTMTWKERTDSVRRVRLGFEIPDILREWHDDETGEDVKIPALLGREVSLTLGKKSALRKEILKPWGLISEVDGGAGLGIVLGLPALITVSHEEKDERMYDNIVAISSLPAGMTAPSPSRDPVLFHMGDTKNPTIDRTIFDELPEWIQERIMKSDEYRQVALGQVKTETELDKDLGEIGL